MPCNIRRLYRTLFALALLCAAPYARALGVGGISGHYTALNDVGFVNIAAITVSVVAESSPPLLTYLGDNIHYDITLGEFFERENRDGIFVTFVYAGPTWQYEPEFLWQGGYLEFGSAVTYLSDQRVGDRNLGGNWLFTSHATVGHQFGAKRHWRVGLRLQHTSNAGIYDHNPGLDALEFEVGYRF